MRRFLQTVRCVLRATIDGRFFELGTDKTWEGNPGPIKYASIYVGVSHDARLETPGWDLPGTNAHIFTYISSGLQTKRNDGFYHDKLRTAGCDENDTGLGFSFWNRLQATVLHRASTGLLQSQQMHPHPSSFAARDWLQRCLLTTKTLLFAACENRTRRNLLYSACQDTFRRT
jgi:hypothetical protein